MLVWRPFLAPLAILGMLLAGCGDTARTEVEATSGDSFVVTRDSANLPKGCSVREVAEIVLTYTEGL